MTGRLGGPRGERLTEALVQRAPPRVVEVGVDRLAQEAVAEAETPVLRVQQTAVHRGEHGVGISDRDELGAPEVASRHGGELDRPARRRRQRRDGGAHRRPQRAGRPGVATGRRAGALEGEQGIAVGHRGDAVAPDGVEAGDPRDQSLDLGPGERGEHELGGRDAAGAGRVQQRVDLVAARHGAAGEDEHDGHARDPAREVGRKLEARPVGEVDVVEEQDERAIGRGVLGELDRGLEQPGAREVGRDVGGRGGRAAQAARQRRREPRELLWPGHLGRGRRELAREARQELGPQPERRRHPEVERPARRGTGSGGPRAGQELGGEPRLPDPALPTEDGERAVAGAGALPQPEQLVQLGRAPDERDAVGGLRSVGGGGRAPGATAARRRGAGAAQRAACSRRWGEPEARAQALAEPVVHRERAGPVAGRRKAPHEVARGRLVERVDGEPAPRPDHRRGGRGGARGEARERCGEPLGVRVARLQHPVLVEVGQQRSRGQLDRRLELPRREVRLEPREVGLAAQAEPVAAGHECVRGRPERPP